MMRIIRLQIGILFGIAETFFWTYNFLVVALSAMLVAFLTHYFSLEPLIGGVFFLIFIILGTVLLVYTIDKETE